MLASCGKSVEPRSTDAVTVEYDKWHDETVASIGDLNDPKWILLKNLEDGKYHVPNKALSAFMMAECRFSGKSVNPSHARIHFLFVGGTTETGAEVVFLLDGKQRIEATNSVSADDAVAIANAKTTELKIGSGE